MNATILTNANVITCDARGTLTRAVAIDAGRVVAVGDEESVLSQAGADAHRVDLGGATVLPGFVDTHPHLMHFGVLAEPLVDLSDAVSHADIVDRIARRARDTEPGEWIMTTPVGEAHYFIRRSYRDLAEGELPDRAVLDRAAPDHPVFIQAWAPVTPNVCAMNSRALRELGIDRTLPDVVDNVWIEKDAAGEPTGRLSGSVTNYYTDSPFMNRLLRQLPLLEPTAIFSGTERAMRAANAMGVTTVYEGHLMVFELVEAYRLLRADNRLTLRVLCSPEAEPFGIPWAGQPLEMRDYLHQLSRARDLVDRTDDLFRVDGVTVSRYGPCSPGFTLMREPYLGPYGEPTTGRSFVSPEKIQQAIAFCHRAGLRLNIVTAGLAELDTHLDQLESLGRAPLAADGRAWLVQNLYFAEPDQVGRLAALGMGVTTTMSFSWGKGELVRERLGEHLLPDFIPLARLLDAGLHVGCGTDWGPKNVFEHIALAVEPHYAASGRRAATPGISRRQALSMWTREAAHVLRWEGIGSLEPGHHADLVVVDRDPLNCPIDEIASTRIIATMLGGKTVAGTDLVGDVVSCPS
ncbi:amidohydrolase [Dactylosporangium sp. McL0621]|uniref:amidohydrolase n=1 Tax=Dactylosporangium sp. McL0621 TaxID=3415678 RepID=UPI003CF25F38